MDTSETSSGDIHRQNNFGSLRLLFAALVVLSHSPELIDGNRSREILARTFGTLSFGELAVDGFFLISGYLITKSFQNSRSMSDYLTKRVLRIYPGFIVAFLVSIFIVGPLAGGNLTQISILKNLVSLCLLSLPRVPGAFNGLPHPELNGAMWTIAYEFRCYLLAIAFGYLATRTNRIGYAALLIGLAILYAVRYKLPDLPHGSAFLGNSADTIRLTFVFFIGGAFYVWRDRIAFTHRGVILAAATLLGFMFVPQVAEPALAVFGGYLIFWYAFASKPNRVSRKMDNTDPSYGLYLYAWPVQNLLIFKVPGIHPWTVTAITLPLAVILGLLSWHIVEKPVLRHKNFFARLKRELADNPITERRSVR